ncbi:MAG: peptide ABC transporter substrate-binding protein [Planctomycetia bacterium]|nr:peptide ABC transporter substrate-binding protein [Planctomycetia bacterium]
MKISHPGLAALGLCFLVVVAWGPRGPKAGAADANAKQTDTKTQDPDTLIEPFTRPPLAELDAKAEWTDQSVLDGLELLRAKQAKEKPLATISEALKLTNTSPQNNAKILSALGRLPERTSDVNWDAPINRTLQMDVKSMNPILASSVAEFDVNGLTGFGLFGFDWTMRPFASKDAVVSWQTSKDRMADKIVLRNDLTWSDGHPITAHDVVFSFRTIMNPKVPVPAQRSGTDKLRWIEAYDDTTLVFFHKEALATNIWNINFSIIPKHIFEKSVQEDPTLAQSDVHVKYENDPICGGAYTIASRQRGQEIVLARRENWYMHKGKQVRDKPYFKTIRFRVLEDTNTSLLALKSGEVDESLLTAEQWTTQTKDAEYYQRNTKASGLEWVYFYFGWNVKTSFFSDVRVRRAMSYAFNHDEMLNKLFYGLYEPSNGMFHRTAWMAPKKPLPFYKQDLDKAEQLLEEAGWTDHDGDGTRDKMIGGRLVPFEFTVLCPIAADRIALCTLLKENLDQIGIVCNVRPLEFTVLQEKTQKHDFQAMFGGWGTGTDPDTSDNLFVTGELRNFCNYSNPDVDKLYEQGRKEFDRDKRAAIYGKIAELIYADQPYTFLYFRNSFYGFNKSLRGYNYSPRGPFNYSPGFTSFWKAVP